VWAEGEDWRVRGSGDAAGGAAGGKHSVLCRGSVLPAQELNCKGLK
jgi:hypothetical protein